MREADQASRLADRECAVGDFERLDTGIADARDPKPAQGRAPVVAQMGERAALGQPGEPNRPGHARGRIGSRSSSRTRECLAWLRRVDHGDSSTPLLLEVARKARETEGTRRRRSERPYSTAESRPSSTSFTTQRGRRYGPSRSALAVDPLRLDQFGGPETVERWVDDEDLERDVGLDVGLAQERDDP